MEIILVSYYMLVLIGQEFAVVVFIYLLFKILALGYFS